MKLRFKALEILERPFIFAYSACINPEVISKTNEVGFDGCLPGLGAEDFKGTIKQHIDPYIDQFIDKEFSKLQQAQYLNNLIKQVDQNALPRLPSLS